MLTDVTSKKKRKPRRASMERECQQCGNTFMATPSLVDKGGGKFCSRQCAGLSQRKRAERTCQYCGEKWMAPQWLIAQGCARHCNQKCARLARTEQGIVESICLYCGEKMTVARSIIDNGGGKFCSLKCTNLARRTAVERTCQQCGNKFMATPSRVKRGGGKFCSQECTHTKVERTCQQCGNKFKTWPGHVKKGGGKFCSVKCMGLGHSGENAYNWLGGKSFEPYPLSFNKRFKRTIRERDGYACAICGHDCSKDKNEPDVHHIDYDKQSTMLRNCITLCHSCHTKTGSNRDYWQVRLEGLMIIRRIARGGWPVNDHRS